MKIKLLVDLPVSPIEGMTAGRVLDVIPVPEADMPSHVAWYVRGNHGARVGVLPREATPWYETCAACALSIVSGPEVPTSCGPMHALCAAEHVTQCGACARGD